MKIPQTIRQPTDPSLVIGETTSTTCTYKPMGRSRRLVGGNRGDWRAPLTPNPKTNIFGRSDFFLHGGTCPGSGGVEVEGSPATVGPTDCCATFCVTRIGTYR